MAAGITWASNSRKQPDEKSPRRLGTTVNGGLSTGGRFDDEEGLVGSSPWAGKDPSSPVHQARGPMPLEACATLWKSYSTCIVAIFILLGVAVFCIHKQGMMESQERLGGNGLGNGLVVVHGAGGDTRYVRREFQSAAFSDKCLSVSSVPFQDGRHIQMGACSGDVATTFFVPSGEESGVIRWSGDSDKCITAVGSVVLLMDCDQGATEFGIPDGLGALTLKDNPTKCINMAGQYANGIVLAGVWDCLDARQNLFPNCAFDVKKAPLGLVPQPDDRLSPPTVIAGLGHAEEAAITSPTPKDSSGTTFASTKAPTTTPAGDEKPKCPGSIYMAGHGQVSLVNAAWDVPGHAATTVRVENGHIVPLLKGRTYMASACTEGPTFNNSEYLGMHLLGKTLSYTTDMSGAGCGCNAALYLTNLRQNKDATGCKDHYCDANKVCGASCAEIDIQEANMYGWRSTLHVWNDGFGMGGGHGGGRNGETWSEKDYGPKGRCIDTREPFQVAVSFPMDGDGQVAGMEVTLTQKNKPCHLAMSVGGYAFAGGNSMADLTEALAMGMTPIISYWSAPSMYFMDAALGKDKHCRPGEDDPDSCPSSVRFYDFELKEMDRILVQEPPVECSDDGESCQGSRCCTGEGHKCFEKDENYATCLPSCQPGTHMEEMPEFRTPWSCKLLQNKIMGVRQLK